MKIKIKAALLHLLISGTIVVLVTGFMLLHFYPSVFLDIENPYDALKILIPADIVLGPLLTFILYKKDKWGLKFDLAVIGLCQIIALGYGSMAIYNARPGFLVLHGDTFFIVPPKVDQSSLAGTPLEVGPFSSPKVVYLELPGDARQRLVLAMESTNAGIPIHWQTKYYKNFQDIDPEKITRAAINPKTLKKKINEKQAIMLEQLNTNGKNHVLIAATGSHYEKIVAVNLATKTPWQTLDISAY
jgi:hypothetical protein